MTRVERQGGAACSHARRAGPRLSSAAILAIALVGCALSWFGCAGSTAKPGESSPSGPPLRVGVAPDDPPIVFEVDGQVVGIEADLARSVAQTLERPIEFERYRSDELIDALLRGEIDVVMSGLSITPEREDRVRFVTPYMEVGQLALIRSRDIARFGRIQNIRRPGARVGYEFGTSGERFVATDLPRAESFGFDDVESGLRSLRADRIDYFIHDAPTVWRLAGDLAHRDLHGLYRPLTTEQLAWAVRPEDDALFQQLDTTLSTWKREGLIEPVVQRWIPVRVRLR